MHMRSEKPQTEVKNIFVDLDETLIHTNLDKENPNEVPEVPVNIDPRPRKQDLYPASLRPGANELLFQLRSIGNVFMLTRAIHPYALAMNKQFNLAFPENRIYSRRDVENYRYKELRIPSGKNYLIDDLLESANYEKITLISQLGSVKYIRVLPFYGNKNEALTTSMIGDIVSTIRND